jgi:hypothetical protein
MCKALIINDVFYHFIAKRVVRKGPTFLLGSLSVLHFKTLTFFGVVVLSSKQFADRYDLYRKRGEPFPLILIYISLTLLYENYPRLNCNDPFNPSFIHTNLQSI